MKNFPITNTDGKTYWVSRAVCVLTIVLAYNHNHELCVLVVQRGKGTPDPEFVGAYCLPCGYVDFDETIVQAAARELKEETGLTFPISDLKLIYINDDPTSDKRQNITFRYLIHTSIPIEDLENLFTTKNSEKDEVDSIRFIKVDDVDMYKWAFNHEKIIKAFCS